MNILMLLIVGAAVGWVASLITATDSREGLIRHIMIGTAGAMVGSWILDLASQSDGNAGITLGAVVAATVGAAVSIAVSRRIGRI